MTMNRSWGYVPDDTEYKSSTNIVHTLCEIAGKSGNLLMNVVPARGRLTSARAGVAAGGRGGVDARARFDASTGPRPALEPWQFYGPSTKSGDSIFLHCLWKPYEDVVVRGMPVQARDRDAISHRARAHRAHDARRRSRRSRAAIRSASCSSSSRTTSSSRTQRSSSSR